MRNKDLKAKDIKSFKNTEEQASETLVLEDQSNSYEELLEKYYHDIKDGKLAIPQQLDVEEFVNELIWLNSSDTEGMTVH